MLIGNNNLPCEIVPSLTSKSSKKDCSNQAMLYAHPTAPPHPMVHAASSGAIVREELSKLLLAELRRPEIAR